MIDYKTCSKCGSKEIEDTTIGGQCSYVGVPVKCLKCGYKWVDEERTLTSSAKFGV